MNRIIIHNTAGNLGITNETDPQVDDNMANNSIPRWDGAKLAAGNIFNDLAGSVGVGTTGPNDLLELSGSKKGIRIHSTHFAGEGGHLDFHSVYSDRTTARIESDASGDGGNFRIGVSDTSEVLQTRLFIDNAGKVGIGTPSPAYKLDVNGNAMVRGPLYLNYSDNRIEAFWTEPHPYLALTAADGYTVLKPSRWGFRVTNYENSWNTLTLNNDGDLWVKRSYSISDDRIKFNDQMLNYGLTQVMALQPKRYDRADYELDPETEEIIIHPERTKNEIGLLAQEVNRIIPEAVSIPEDENREFWSISYETIIPVLIKAIQEQQNQINELKQEIAALKAR